MIRFQAKKNVKTDRELHPSNASSTIMLKLVMAIEDEECLYLIVDKLCN